MVRLVSVWWLVIMFKLWLGVRLKIFSVVLSICCCCLVDRISGVRLGVCFRVW